MPGPWHPGQTGYMVFGLLDIFCPFLSSFKGADGDNGPAQPPRPRHRAPQAPKASFPCTEPAPGPWTVPQLPGDLLYWGDQGNQTQWLALPANQF